MDRPNILIILSDQHSPHAMGCAGDSVVRTPNLDALAGDGVRFSNTYCPGPLCVPSRMGFLTSRYPSDIQVWTNSCLLDPNTPTFAHSLTMAGYETVLCGRMHFAGREQHHGFLKRLVGDVSGARDETLPLFEDRIPYHTTGQYYRSVQDVGVGKSSYMAFDDDVTIRACEYLQQRDAENDNSPFCLLAGYLLPHNPYICPADLFDEYMDKLDELFACQEDVSTLHPAVRHWREIRGVDKLTPQQIRRARAAYYGLVTCLDEQIGKLLASLESTSFADNTIVVYLSDHGEMAGEHGMWWKESFYEASVGVPMIWSWPGRFRLGCTDTSLTSLLDVAPTCLKLANAEALPFYRGQSLLPQLESGTDATVDEDRMIYSEMNPRDMNPAKMVRQGRWKLNYYYGYDRVQLFDIENDPSELCDLGELPEYAEIRSRLLEQLLQGWSGEEVQRITARREEDYFFMERCRKVNMPDESEIWSVPVGSNCVQFIGN